MAHEAPTPALTPARDARTRAIRSTAQALAVTAIVGAATGVYQLAADGDVLSLATVATTAGAGALMAVGAWVHRKLEAVLEEGRRTTPTA